MWNSKATSTYAAVQEGAVVRLSAFRVKRWDGELELSINSGRAGSAGEIHILSPAQTLLLPASRLAMPVTLVPDFVGAAELVNLRSRPSDYGSITKRSSVRAAAESRSTFDPASAAAAESSSLQVQTQQEPAGHHRVQGSRRAVRRCDLASLVPILLLCCSSLETNVKWKVAR